MPDEMNEDMKEKIRNKYKEIQEKETIEKAASDLGVSEASFHKYKNSKSEIEETSPEDKTKNFNEDFKEDKKEEEEENEEEENETYEVVF